MSLEWIFGLLAGFVVVLGVGLVVAVWRLDLRADQTDGLFRRVERELLDLRRRTEALEAGPEPAPSVTTPSVTRQRPSPTSYLEEQQSPTPHHRSPVEPPPTQPAPRQQATWSDFCDEAAKALTSAAAFNAFAERYRIGHGYTLEASGPPPVPVNGLADRADVYILAHPHERSVFPAFNLRRGQGLLTSDAGRAAEARLGWLFSIEPGPDLRAIEPAILELNGWTVRQKGRLSLPL